MNEIVVTILMASSVLLGLLYLLYEFDISYKIHKISHNFSKLSKKEKDAMLGRDEK